MKTKFFNVLFDEGQHTCFAKHSKGTTVYNVNNYNNISWANYFTINALHPILDLNPSEEYHSADKPRRADHNVVCFRNILIEMDGISVDEQKKLVQESGLPYSTAVFSGGKSVHYIISLENPVSSSDELKNLSERVYRALGGKKVVDVSCKNPSRLSRFPDADRDGVKQDLLEVKERVSNQVLIEWIESKIGPDIKIEKSVYTSNKNYSSGNGTLSGYTLHFMMFGAEEGSRNSTLFKAACDFANCGYDREDAINKLGRKADLPYDEIVRTVKSAYNKVESTK